MKTEAEKQTQKAIVCAYLLYRHSRELWRHRQKPNKLMSLECMQRFVDDAWLAMNENWNTLQILKRVLWHDNWD